MICTYGLTDVEVNKDVLRLARHFGFSHLHEHAACASGSLCPQLVHWLFEFELL